MKVIINRTDGNDPIVIADAVKPPWTYRTFLVVDRGIVGHLTYVPNDLIESFEVEGVVL